MSTSPQRLHTIAVVFSHANPKFSDYAYKLAVFAVKHFPKFSSPASHSDLIIHNPQEVNVPFVLMASVDIWGDARGKMGKA